MTGQAFLPHLAAYAAARGLPCRMSTVESDAATSRHLATCRGSFAGFDVDLVNLRSETYAADAAHRVPTAAAIGTPREDALRRDFTANALFLNLHTGLVEDWHGGAGLADLRAGVLRTPLPPLQTFADDPLRVLRVVRFAARLGFLPAPGLAAAAATPAVRRALARKVSRERVGIELAKALEAPAGNLAYALALLRALGTVDAVVPRAAVRRLAAAVVAAEGAGSGKKVKAAPTSPSPSTATAEGTAAAASPAGASAAPPGDNTEDLLAAAGPAGVARALQSAPSKRLHRLAMLPGVSAPPPGARPAWRRRQWARVEAVAAAVEAELAAWQRDDAALRALLPVTAATRSAAVLAAMADPLVVDYAALLTNFQQTQTQA